MKAEADQPMCCGAGMCVLTAPEVFDQDDDGVVRLLRADVPAEHEQAVRDAVDACPSGAISLVE